MPSSRRVCLALIACLLSNSAATAEAAPRFKRCDPLVTEITGLRAECARLRVPLDPDGRVPGGLSLFIERVRAEGRRKGVVIALTGGPGAAGTPSTLTFAEELSGFLGDHDLVVIDQRGTGRSGLLRCRALERSPAIGSGGPAAAACAQRLGARSSLYTTRQAVFDIDRVRESLGVEKVSLYGVSFGSKLAQAYAALFPGRVERLVLDSPVPLEGTDPLSRPSYAAIRRVVAKLCDRTCRSFTRDPLADLATLTARLQRAPLRGYVVDRRGRRRAAELTEGGVLDVLYAGDYYAEARQKLPAAVAAALRGDAAPLLRIRHDTEDDLTSDPSQFSVALYAASVCEEERFPWARQGTPEERLAQGLRSARSQAAGTFTPFSAESALIGHSLCAHWPAAITPPDLGSTLPDVPALVLSGGQDLRTPTEDAERVLGLLPAATLVKAADTGHDVLGRLDDECTSSLVDDWLAGERLPATCRGTRVKPAPAYPASLQELRAVRGVRGLRGRALAAVERTLNEAAYDAVLAALLAADEDEVLGVGRGSGLRGGTFVFGYTYRLRGLHFVPGVRVTGRMATPVGGGTIRFSAPRVRGKMFMDTRGRVRGVINRRRFRARLRIDPFQGLLAKAERSVLARQAATGRVPLGR